MAVLTWDDAGKRFFEAGVDRAVLYLQDQNGNYPKGVAWNGVIDVTEKPSGAETTQFKADGEVYATLVGGEEFELGIEAYTYPDEFMLCDGMIEARTGVVIGQQERQPFGLCYRTKVGNDIDGEEHAYKLHLVYGAVASPSERAYSTINDSPEPSTFSWDLKSTPVGITGYNYKPLSVLTLDSRKIPKSAMADIESALYGTASANPRLPLPEEIANLSKAAPTISLRQSPWVVPFYDPTFAFADYFKVVDGDGKDISTTATFTSSPSISQSFLNTIKTVNVTVSAKDPVKAGKTTTQTFEMSVVPATTLYNDGFMQMNETTTSQRSSAISSHGSVIKEWYTDCEKKRWNFSSSSQPWYSYRNQIKNINILGTITPAARMDYWFEYLTELLTLTGTENINATNVTSITYGFRGSSKIENVVLKFQNASKLTNWYEMFWNCTALKTVDLSGTTFGTVPSTSTGYFFENNPNLTTVYVRSDLQNSNFSSSTTTFTNTPLLVGGAGTAWNSSNRSTTHAKIDGGSSNPGYFTAK